MTPVPAVIVLASAWDSSGVAELLGPDRVRRVGELMLTRAAAWATASFGADAVSVVTAPPHPAGEALAAAIARAEPDRPLIVAIPRARRLALRSRPGPARRPRRRLPAGDRPGLRRRLLPRRARPSAARPGASCRLRAWTGGQAMTRDLRGRRGRPSWRSACCAPSGRCGGPTDVHALLADPLTDEELGTFLQ